MNTYDMDASLLSGNQPYIDSVEVPNADFKVIIIMLNQTDTSSMVTEIKSVQCPSRICFSLSTLHTYLKQTGMIASVLRYALFFYKGNLLTNYTDISAITEPICCYCINKINDSSSSISSNVSGLLYNSSHSNNLSTSILSSLFGNLLGNSERNYLLSDLIQPADPYGEFMNSGGGGNSSNQLHNPVESNSGSSSNEEKEENEEKESEEYIDMDTDTDSDDHAPNSQTGLYDNEGEDHQLVVEIRDEPHNNNMFIDIVNQALQGILSAASEIQTDISVSSNEYNIPPAPPMPDHNPQLVRSSANRNNDIFQEIVDTLYSMGFTSERDILDAAYIADGDVGVAISYIVNLH